MSGLDALNTIDMAAALLDGKGYAVAAHDVREARAAVAELIEAMRAIDYAADHHHTGCLAGPMQRMPADLREAILTARAALARIGGAA